MKLLIIGAALGMSLFCNTVTADDLRASKESGGITQAQDRIGGGQSFGMLTLTDGACVKPEIVAQILPQFLTDFKAGRILITDPALAKSIGKEVVDFCYDESEGKVFLVDEFGNQVALDPESFKPSGPSA
jgi:hypothetical protein